MPRYALLDSQDPFADLTAAIFYDRWLPVPMRPTQLFDQASSKPKLGEGSLESVFMLQFFALLRRQIGLKKNFARIVLLADKEVARQDKKEEDEQSRTDSPHATMRRHDRPATTSFSLHGR